MLLRDAITRNSLKLGVFAVITAGILAGTNLGTKERIAEQEKIAKGKALLQIVRRRDHDNQMLDDTWDIPENLLHFLGTTNVTTKMFEITLIIMICSAKSNDRISLGK